MNMLEYARKYAADGWAITPILYKKKKAFLTKWTERSFPTDDDLVQWFGNSHKHNIGVRTGAVSGNLVVLDCDMAKMKEELLKMLPQLWNTRQSKGKKDGGHLWLYSDQPIKSFSIKTQDDQTVLDFMADGKQVLVAPSEHMDSTVEKPIFYSWLNELPLITIPHDVLLSAIAHISKMNNWKFKDQDIAQAEIKPTIKEKESTMDIKLRFEDMLDFSKMNKVGDEYVGSHPWHGSDTGENFHINPITGVWHCFRCESGGGVLSLFAVKEGIISCGDAKKEGLKGEKFKRTVALIRERFGKDTVKFTHKRELSFVNEAAFIAALAECVETNEKGIATFKAGKARHLLADYIMGNFQIYTFADNEDVVSYDAGTGLYMKNGGVLISSSVQHLMERASLESYIVRNLVEEVRHFIKRSTFISRDEFDEAPHFLCLDNGVLNLNTYGFEPHSYRYRFMSKLPVRYDSTASCENFDKFLHEIVADDDVGLIYEMIGYCLYRSYPIHRAFLFIGAGANGKSTLISIVEKLLGVENCAHVSLQDIEEKGFKIAELHTKHANFYADLPSKALSQTGKFKMLTGGDSITAEFKYQQPFNFKNHAKFIFSCNTIPATQDNTNAFFRRWILLNFPKRFEGKAANKKLIAELTTPKELSGILNKSIAALQHLLAEGDFSYSATVEEVQEQYIRMSDSTAAFIMDCLDPDVTVFIARDELYNLYLDYCRTHKCPIDGDKTFFKKLREQTKVTDGKKLIDDELKRVFFGIKLKESKTEE